MTASLAFSHGVRGNHGRWGEADELGLLNLVDDDARRRAAALVRTGEVVVLGRPLPRRGSSVSAHPVVHRMLESPGRHTAVDEVTITPHDPQITHVDALGHTWLDGVGWNGRRRQDTVRPEGLTSLGVDRLRAGILTRGVLLDIASARGVSFLAADVEVTAADLDDAARAAGVSPSAGDAVVLHVGRAARIGHEGGDDHPVPRAGLGIDAVRWLGDRDVAVFAGDCTERLPPAPDAAVPFPLHQLGAALLGMCLVDGVLTSPLATTCSRLGRHEFMFCCTIPELPGGTGFPVNPLAVF